MKFLKYSSFNFSFDFFQRGITPPFYQSISSIYTKEIYKNEAFKEIKNLHLGIQEIKFIPDFFQLNPPKLSSQYKQTSFNRVENFYINLEGFTSAEDYLKSQFGSKSRSQLRMRKQRLEECFDVEYKFYYGKIDKLKYDELFDTLEELIKRRFIQRGEPFSQKNNLSTIRANSYQMILKKKSSFFVIYADGKIIDVCLNYHFQNVVQHFIRSYDIDYSKFGIGQIDIYNQLEICFQYNFTIFDFMWGELDYKNKWSNSIEIYKHQFIYKNTFVNWFLVFVFIRFYKINDWLRSKKIYKKIKAKIINAEKQTPNKITIRTEELPTNLSVNSLQNISITDDNYSFIRKIVYDFQYLNFEKTADTNVYKISNESYLISGIKKQLKVHLS